jgi:maltooligosyltrehalose trehalohydrolase
VIYELHVGTFTSEGTWSATAAELPELADLGVTCVEVMPVADFPGRFGWGYDGVNLFAPTRLYGTPDDFRRFVDTAHGLGIGVILDVVYNHLGPDGNYLGRYADNYFTDRHQTDWGRAINFDGPDAGPVREYYLANAAYWIEEFQLDGLRLDATQTVFDDSPPGRHILTEIGRAARRAANGRAVVVVCEDETEVADLCRPTDRGGYGLDGLWNDDFHHAARVALTGKREAYYADFRGTAQELVSAAKHGFLYQGQWYSWQKTRRGRPALDLPPTAFINFLQNHDQVANSGQGLRLHQLTSPGRYRAMTAYLLLAPGTPMLFQGQEFAASAPFLFFADHTPELAAKVRAGRAEFLSRFRSLGDPDAVNRLDPPEDERTFTQCVLDLSERESHAAAYQLTKDLLRIRREVPAFQVIDRRQVDGAVLGEQTFCLRYFFAAGERLLVVNLGPDLHLDTCPEPLLAPPAGAAWAVELSTDAIRYGGQGVYSLDTEAEGWRVPGECAVILRPEPLAPRSPIR